MFPKLIVVPHAKSDRAYILTEWREGQKQLTIAEVHRTEDAEKLVEAMNGLAALKEAIDRTWLYLTSVDPHLPEGSDIRRELREVSDQLLDACLEVWPDE